MDQGNQRIHIGCEYKGVNAFKGDIASLAVCILHSIYTFPAIVRNNSYVHGNPPISSHCLFLSTSHTQIFSSALSESTIQKLSSAQTISHTVLESVVCILQLRREQVVLLSTTSQEVVQAKAVEKEVVAQLEKEDQESVC